MLYHFYRLPIFVKQLYKFFEAFREQLTKDITESQKQEVAAYLVPEVSAYHNLPSPTGREWCS